MTRCALAMLAAFLGCSGLLAQGPAEVTGLRPAGVNPLPQTPFAAQAAPNAAAGPAAAGSAALQENLNTFDPAKLEIRKIDNRWHLVSDGVWIKDFGGREREARDALRLLRELRLNQHGTIGSPRPVLEYWLAEGQAPAGRAVGMHLSAMDVGTLRVEKIDNQWTLRDAHRVYFTFGDNGAEAQRALEVIRRHRFTQIGQIGAPSPSMVYFMGNPPNPALPSGPAAQPTDGNARADAPTGGTSAAKRVEAKLKEAALANVADTPTGSQRVPFDASQVTLRRDGVDWKLFYGHYPLANFGPNRGDAVQAQRVFQYYRFSEQQLIGDKQPSFAFFLVDGQAPRGLMYGVGSQAFRPEQTLVRQQGRDWVLCDGQRSLLNFGERRQDAQQLLHAIQQYHFDCLCRVGRAEPYAMTFLVRTR